MFSVPTIRSSYLDANVKQPDDFNSCSQSKKYGRSHSEMILPGIERSGELIDSSKPPPNNPWLKYFFSLSLHERTPKILTSTGQIKVEKRSHLLLLYISKCFCYNCNISKLILKSEDLPFVEHFNFDIYFVRSLLYKFFNCYLNLQEDADSNCIPCNISFDNNYRNFKEIPQLNHPNLSFVCLKDKFSIFLEKQSFYLELRFDYFSVHYLKSNDHSESIPFKKKEKWRFNKNVTQRTFNGGSVIVKNIHIAIKNLPCLNLRYDVFSYIDAIYSNKYGEGFNCSKIYKCWSYPNLNGTET